MSLDGLVGLNKSFNSDNSAEHLDKHIISIKSIKKKDPVEELKQKASNQDNG